MATCNMGPFNVCLLILLAIAATVCIVSGVIGLMTCTVKTDATIDFGARLMHYVANNHAYNVSLDTIDRSLLGVNQTSVRICYAKAAPHTFHLLVNVIYIPFGVSVALLLVGSLILTTSMLIWLYMFVLRCNHIPLHDDPDNSEPHVARVELPPASSIKADSVDIPHSNVMIGVYEDRNVVVINPFV